MIAAKTKPCLCGVQVDGLSMEEVLVRARDAIRHRRSLSISVVNVAKVVNMRRDDVLRDSVLAGDVILADGMPLVWLSRARGIPIPGRVTGIDLMYRLFELADQHAMRVYLLGAKAETLERVVSVARARYPNMVLAGHRDGHFTNHQESQVAADVRRARPDILLVAISSPKKELFMRRWSRFMDVPVCHGVGGSFDVMAGQTRRAPFWLQRSGLEWLYRLGQEPRRMWKRYLRTNILFAGLAPSCVLCRQNDPAAGHCPWRAGSRASV